tara:strand:- start:25530 stop:26381 length:852 start_codon:yes stop_codon:yes gene_type:complete
MRIPKEVTYAEAYLTLKCGLGCSYCINSHSGVSRNRDELSAKEWTDWANNVEWDGLSLTLGGGEPTEYKEFYELINRLDESKVKVDLLTNVSFDVDRFVKNISPDKFSKGENLAYKSIRVSYHPERHNPKELVEKVNVLQENGFHAGIFGINHQNNVTANMEMAELARNKKIYFYVKDFLGEFDGTLFGHFKYLEGLDGNSKDVMCRNRELLVGPKGSVFKCHRDLYHNELPIGNILSPEDIELYKFRECHHYGKCNPCDIKQKTNRFLQTGNCQVEIKPLNE